MPGFDHLVRRIVGERFDVSNGVKLTHCTVRSMVRQRAHEETYTITIVDEEASCELEINWDRDVELFSIIASPEIKGYTPFHRAACLDIINVHHNDADNVSKASLIEYDGKMFCTLRVTCHVPKTFLEAPSSYLPAREFLLGNLSAVLMELIDLFDDFEGLMRIRRDESERTVVPLKR